MRNDYVLVTAAYNEEKYIAATIESIVCQVQLPLRWIIVSDCSDDQTDQIVTKYSSRYSFIQLHRISDDHPRNFMAQVHAINRGIALCDGLDYSYIGNVDADITVGPSYFTALLDRFVKNPRLGLAGGYIHEPRKGGFEPRKTNSVRAVPHAVQLFRRKCFEEIGRGYKALPFGGPDWHAEVSARMRRWEVSSFPDIAAYHHRPTGAAEGLPASWYRMGLMDHSLGSHPVFEGFKVMRRLGAKPYVIGALIRLWAFCGAHYRREPRPVPPEFVDFLRHEQLERVKRFLLLRKWGADTRDTSQERVIR